MSTTTITTSFSKPSFSRSPTWQPKTKQSRPVGLSRHATASPAFAGSLFLIGSEDAPTAPTTEEVRPVPTTCQASLPPSVSHGHSHTSTGVKIMTLPKFTLENGYTFPSVTVAYQTWGTLNQSADNAILVCHSLTSATDVDSWWPGLLGDKGDKPLDTRKSFIVCANVLGSPYGTTSPLTTNPATGKPYGASFPQTTVRDDARLQRRLLEVLGVCSLEAVVGGSLGGMVALEFAATYPAFVRSLVCIGAPARTSAWALALGALQRAMLSQPGGLGLARMLAMVSYRTPASYDRKFGRTLQPSLAAPKAGNDYLATLAGAGDAHTVQSYLAHQANKFDARFDSDCYAHLTHKLDSHDVLRGRLGPHLRGEELPPAGTPFEAAALRQALERVPRALIVGIPSDCLFPLPEVQRLAAALPNAEMKLLESEDGHDAFLIEQTTLGGFIDAFLNGKSQ